MQRSIFLGYDSRETEAFVVARRSMRRFASGIPIDAICLDDMRDLNLYYRPTENRHGKLWDVISEAPMSTEFAISRFLTPYLAKGQGWALFADCDVLARAPIHELFAMADPNKAVMCVKHQHEPSPGVKMDGQMQTRYARKNWSSLMLFNCEHPANAELTVDLINKVPGRDLHGFCWLKDKEIGSLDPAWNFLVGHSDPSIDPKLVHFTEGGPWLPQYRDVPFADAWKEERRAWLEEEVRVPGRPSTWGSKFTANGVRIGC